MIYPADRANPRSAPGLAPLLLHACHSRLHRRLHRPVANGTPTTLHAAAPSYLRTVAHPRFSSSSATEVPQDRSARGLHPHVPHERTLATPRTRVLGSALLMLFGVAARCVRVLGATPGSRKRRASRPRLPRASPTASRTAPPPTGALHPPPSVI
jgi:hypothetical protein